jgi:hypothetical protein
LNSARPRPSERPSSGSFFGPKTMRATKKSGRVRAFQWGQTCLCTP